MKKYTLLWNFLFLCSSINALENLLPAPYNSIEILPFKDDATLYGNSHQIENLFAKYNIRTVIEIGCWTGCSTRHLANQVPADGKVYAVDHFMGSKEHIGDSRLPLLYQQFLSNIIHRKLTDKIVPVRMSSLDASIYLTGVKPDLIYLDASHETEDVLHDLHAWYPFVQDHGILCGDDWSWPSVAIAVKAFAEEKKLELYVADNFWRLIDPQTL